jgi:hypothetical protein
MEKKHKFVADCRDGNQEQNLEPRTQTKPKPEFCKSPFSFYAIGNTPNQGTITKRQI